MVHIQSGKKPFLLLPPMGEDFRPEYLVILGHNIKIPELLKDIANRKYRLNITKIESAKDTLTILGYLQEKGVNENLTIFLIPQACLPKQVVAHHHSSDNQG